MTVLPVVLAVGFAFAIGVPMLIGPGAGITAGFLLALAPKAAGVVLLARA